MTFEERSVCSKENQRNIDPEKRRQICAAGGKAGSRVGMERKSGIFGLTAEQRTANGKKVVQSQRKMVVHFITEKCKLNGVGVAGLRIKVLFG